nr:hypothetical protein CFP56_33696 [Quercus suber]
MSSSVLCLRRAPVHEADGAGLLWSQVTRKFAISIASETLKMVQDAPSCQADMTGRRNRQDTYAYGIAVTATSHDESNAFM